MAELVKCILTPNGVRVCGEPIVKSAARAVPIGKATIADSRICITGRDGGRQVAQRRPMIDDRNWGRFLARAAVLDRENRAALEVPSVKKLRKQLERIQKGNRALEARLDSQPISHIAGGPSERSLVVDTKREALLLAHHGDAFRKARAARAVQERVDKVLVTVQIDTDPDDDDVDDWDTPATSMPTMSPSVAMGKLMPAGVTPSAHAQMDPTQQAQWSSRGAVGAENPSGARAQALRQPAHVRARQDRQAALAKVDELTRQIRARG